MKKTTCLTLASAAAVAMAGFSTSANAHMVTFGWKEMATGTVLYAEHWHGDLPFAYSDNGGLHITDTATNATITVPWTGVINNTPEAALGLTGSQADSANCCQGLYNDWMFTDAIPLGNGIYDFFTGQNCCVDTMSDPERVTITGIINQPPGIGGAIPEPSTWAMMILGIGFAGAAMRSRRQQAKVRFAF